jgi:hypothetical protein
MLLLSQGYRRSNLWWYGAHWDKLKTEVPGWLLEQLEIFQRVIESVDQEVKRLTIRVAKEAPEKLPKGMGALTHEVIEREIKD